MNKLIILFSLLFIVFQCYCQSIDDLKEQKQKNLKELELTKSLLSETKTKKDQTLNDLLILDKQIKLRQSLINQVENEIINNNYRNDTIDTRILILENQLKLLKEEYARIIVNSYKRKDENNFIMFVFSAKSFNQAYKRIRYFQQYSNFRIDQKNKIIAKNKNLIHQKLLLDSIVVAKIELKNSKINESNNLQKERGNYEYTFLNLKKKEKKLKQEFDYQQKLTKKLDDAIAKLIEKEFKKDSEGRDYYKLTPQQKAVSSEFTFNKGLLPWPTERGVIIKTFGEQQHPVFKYVKTYNKGVDFATPPNSTARSVFNGEVKSILSIPGSHKAILIRHGEYLTVYSNLSVVNVNIGDIVKTFTNLGTVFTNSIDNKGILHFEIWHENRNLDPGDWIKNN